MRVGAVVLAGRANDGRLKDVAAAEWEALIDIAGKPMLQYVVDALEGSSSVGDIAVVGPGILASSLKASRARVVPPAGGLVDNVMAGFDSLSRSGKMLVATSDIPLVTTEVVDGFLRECGDLDADFYYPIVRRETMEARYPGVKRTYAGLRDGSFTGGNVFLADLGVADRLRDTLEFLVENRKKPGRMAAVLGIAFVFKLLFRLLTISEAEKKAGELYGIRAKAVITDYPEIGFDVDKPSDLGLVSRILSKAA
ncbi:MAG: nucleotidyltransferase family protein [Firmicutes bacterium]|jgi:2-phospho-L-lactate guanylyltransferase (CobY/MobA/RfbA family)|nr:nucleotidyltransferase family protein [Bacillota bacterium]